MKTRKSFVIGLVMALFITMISSGMAAAGQKVITALVSDVAQGTTSKGEAYTRIIVEADGDLQGIKFKYGIPAMCFGPLAGPGLTYSPGDTLKAIVIEKDYNGSPSYTVLALISD